MSALPGTQDSTRVLSTYFCMELREIHKKSRVLAEIFEGRIDYIVQKISEAYNLENAEWEWTEGTDMHIGVFCAAFSQYPDGEYDRELPMAILSGSANDVEAIIHGDLVSLRRSIPTRWLFEDFEEELLNSRIGWKQ
jgi:hypothetical protein